jgi:broad specificity phosphatase PhoE
VRHAEPETTGLLLGRSDPGLSEAGRAQAATLLASLNVAAIYSSPLRRARETAQLAIESGASQHCRCVIVLDDLTEITYGDWDGLAWPEIECRWPDLAARKLADWPRVTPPGGESWQLFTERVHRALERIRLGPFPAMVVAHSTVNSVLHHDLVGGDPFTFLQHCGEIRRYEL